MIKMAQRWNRVFHRNKKVPAQKKENERETFGNERDKDTTSELKAFYIGGCRCNVSKLGK